MMLWCYQNTCRIESRLVFYCTFSVCNINRYVNSNPSRVTHKFDAFDKKFVELVDNINRFFYITNCYRAINALIKTFSSNSYKLVYNCLVYVCQIEKDKFVASYKCNRMLDSYDVEEAVIIQKWYEKFLVNQIV